MSGFVDVNDVVDATAVARYRNDERVRWFRTGRRDILLGQNGGQMAIFGAHMLFYSAEPEKVRALLRDVFGFKYVDAHEGWLIFALPPAELGVHPGEGPNYESGIRHEIAFMCDDIGKTVAELRERGVSIEGEPQTESYGITATMELPGGPRVMIYEPRHATAINRA